MPETSFRDLSAADRQLLVEGASSLPEALQQMGFWQLRPGQEDPVMSILSGKDTICILPTGTGKTAVFILPSLCHGWPTIILSPLVALMRDQCKSLWDKGIAAGAVSGLQTPAENASVLKAWIDGEVQFLYVAPERLSNAQFKLAVAARPPVHVVVDEAHTVSQWSDNFRPALVEAGNFVAHVNPRVVSAFTATCPADVEADIRRVLGIPNAKRCMYYPRRTNLQLTSGEYEGITQLARMVRNTPGSGIIYCSSIRNTVETATQLEGLLDEPVAIFHGELPSETKRINQDLFMSGAVRVVVATTAFGMGIDKPDIRFVIHRDMPGSLEQLAQEVGRAGRDGLPSLCCSLRSKAGQRTQEYFLDMQNPDKSTISQVYQTLKARADASGKVMLTAAEIGRLSGVKSDYVSSSLSVLVGAGAIQRSKSEEKVGRIRFIDPHTPELELLAEDVKFSNASALVKLGGVLVGDNTYEVDLNWLATKADRDVNTIARWFTDWDKVGLLAFTRPFRGSVTHVTGGLELVDFERLRKKSAAEYRKLLSVLEYFDTPDDKKHDFIEKHFDIDR